MKLLITKNKWNASIGFAVIVHTYPSGWTWDILLGNRNYTVGRKTVKKLTPNDYYGRSCDSSGHIWGDYGKAKRCIFCGQMYSWIKLK